MRLLRNAEVVRWLALGGAMTLICVALSGRVPAELLLLLLGLGWAVSGLVLLSWRYRQLSRLAEDLRRVERGEYQLSWPEYREGELSLLAAEITKITERLQQQADTLRQEKEQLVALLADISHQYRTPLTSMLMLSDFLSEDSLLPEQRERFSMELRSQLERLEKLVNSLLTLAKLDAGLAMKREPVNMAVVTEKALQPLRIPLELRQIEVELQLGTEAIYFPGDETWTVEAVVNLIKNAMEHTPAGGCITIAAEQNPFYSKLSVTNTGEGIPTDEMPFLFERFFRGRRASANSIGIGLAIVRAIARSQGGDIEVSSFPGQGATFSLKFYHSIE